MHFFLDIRDSNLLLCRLWFVEGSQIGVFSFGRVVFVFRFVLDLSDRVASEHFPALTGGRGH
jgi:hypothetical protein